MFRFFILRVGFQIAFQYVAVEDINAHGSQVAFGLSRFFLEFIDAHRFVGDHDAEAAGFVPGNADRRDGDFRLMLFVEGQHLSVVHRIDMVARQDEDVVVSDHFDEIQVLINSVGRAAVPVGTAVAFIRRQDICTAPIGIQVPRAAVADVPVQFQRLVLGQDADGIDAGVAAVTERKVDNAVFTAEQESGLGLIFRQDAQTAPSPASQNHCQTIGFSHIKFLLTSRKSQSYSVKRARYVYML